MSQPIAYEFLSPIRRHGSVLMLFAAFWVGCGSGNEEELTKLEAKAAAAAETCEEQLGDFLGTLQDLDNRLGIGGVELPEYSGRVGNINSAYGQINARELSDECRELVGAPAADALNDYEKAQDVWSGCFQDISCDTNFLDLDLKAKWASARSAIEDAEMGLDEIAEPE